MVHPYYIFLLLVLGVSQASLDVDESPPSPSKEPLTSPSPVSELPLVPVPIPVSESPVSEPSSIPEPTSSSALRGAPKIRLCKMGRVSPVILVHGGAGDIPDSAVQEKIDGVKQSALVGYKVLCETGLVLNAIEASINIMEDLEGFNAGRGSVLTLTGEVEMEALITEGKDLKAGAITLAKNIRYPISVARKVMEKTPHTFLGGAGLEDFIKKENIPRVGDDWLITDRAKYALEKFIEQGGRDAVTEIGKRPGDVGTVGSVAVDSSGHVGSGTSTGGICGKYKGRIGDTPQLGSGGYSDDKVGAVSTTGYGEAIMRYNLAHRILSKMDTGINAQEATKWAVEGMTERIKKTAGAITVSNSGEIGISFTSKRMSWAYVKDGEIHFGIEQGQHEVEKL
uniref:L-asparaginase CG7860 n=5 Tax=Lygus hesperus TaxID=30085 RepID=A0A0K8SW86_LYGHE